MLLGGQWPGYPESRVPKEGTEGPGYTSVKSDTELGFLRELGLSLCGESEVGVQIPEQASPSESHLSLSRARQASVLHVFYV